MWHEWPISLRCSNSEWNQYYLLPNYHWHKTKSPFIFACEHVHRFSASEALNHPWITGEGHFDQHRKHLLTACNSFRLHKNETFTDKVDSSLMREDKKNGSDKKDVFKSKLPIPKDSKLSPIRTFRQCLPGAVYNIRPVWDIPVNKCWQHCLLLARRSNHTFFLVFQLTFLISNFSPFQCLVSQILQWIICERRASRRVLSAVLCDLLTGALAWRECSM